MRELKLILFLVISITFEDSVYSIVACNPDCINGGSCIDDTCYCFDNWNGSYCQTCTLACGNGEAANEFCDACILQNICQSDSPCQHGGVCIRGSGPDEYSCDCSQTNYIGINCTTALSQFCSSANEGSSFTYRDINGLHVLLCPLTTPLSCADLVYRDCSEWFTKGYEMSGVYNINPDNGETAFEVYCDMETDDRQWAVFQRRMDGSVDFYRVWTDYEDGFGDLNGEFWLGLKKIHRLTQDSTDHTLRVDMEDFDTEKRWAEYDTFNVGDTISEYTLTIGGHSGIASDCMNSVGNNDLNGRRFTTLDNDNDLSGVNCAVFHRGAWWYNACHRSNLNGFYFGGEYEHGDNDVNYADGVNWETWRGFYYSLKFTEMKVLL